MVVGQFSQSVDVAIVGAGVAGLAAAIESHARGRSVAVVRHGEGCRLPRRVADPLAAACEAMGIEVLDGDAVLDGDRQLRIPGNMAVPRLRFRRLILTPDLAVPAPADASLASPWSAAVVTAAPPRDGAVALIRGGGVAECAAAASLAIAGWTVRMAPGDAGLLPEAGTMIRGTVAARLRELGVQVLTAVAAAAAEGEAGSPHLVLDAATLSPRIDGLGLEGTAVRLEGGRIAVDEQLRTDDPRILAAGAAVAGPMAEGRWARQGRHAAAVAAGDAAAFDESLAMHVVPLGAGYAAWCGSTDTQPPTLRSFEGDAGPAARCRLLFDDGGLLAGAALDVAAGSAAATAELLLAVEMAVEAEDLALTARDPGDPAAIAISRAAAVAAAAMATARP